MPNEQRFRPYAAAYLALIREGKVLLLKRFNTGYQDGKYSLVSGHLDGGETARECMVREAKEEAGIAIDVNNLEVIHITHRFRPEREYIDIYLSVTEWSGDITNMEPHKCDELDWHRLDSLPGNMVPEVRQALENISDGLFYGEFGWTS